MDWPDLAFWFLYPVGLAAFWRVGRWLVPGWWRQWLPASFLAHWIELSCVAIGIGVIARHRNSLLGGGVNLAVSLVIWWWKRRGRKLAARLLGAVSRALRAALVRTMRERYRPRPVLRPVPVPR